MLYGSFLHLFENFEKVGSKLVEEASVQENRASLGRSHTDIYMYSNGGGMESEDESRLK